MKPSRPCPQCGGEVRPEAEICVHCGARLETPAPASDDAGGPPRRSLWIDIGRRLQRVTGERFRIHRLLGYGGMAGVYLAWEPGLERWVAIKVMSPTLMGDPQLVERFHREARTIAKLEHPHIVTIFEVDEGDDLHYFAMSFIRGRTLGEVVAERVGPLPVPAAKVILSQVADALAYAHRAGVVHRDVKPGNILVDDEGSARVTDFGIAKVSDTPGLTRTGMIVGTPSYMSPEQCSGSEVTGASDQYSLGAVGYHLLTGRPPFGGSTLRVLQAHMDETPRPVDELRPECPPELAGAVLRMLEKRPGDRWTDLPALVRALDAPRVRYDDPVSIVLRELGTRAAELETTPAEITLAGGEKQPVKAVVRDSHGNVLADRKVSWASSDRDVAVVGEGGVVGAIGPGETEVKASVGGAGASVAVRVTPGPEVEKLSIGGVPAALELNASSHLRVRATLRDGSVHTDPAVRWSSSDRKVASVSQDGLVRGVGEGETEIEARLGEVAAAAVVRVTEAAPARTPAGGVGVAGSRASGVSSGSPGRSPSRGEGDRVEEPASGAPDPRAGRSSTVRRAVLLGGAAVAVVGIGAWLVLAGTPEPSSPEVARDEAVSAASPGEGIGREEPAPGAPGVRDEEDIAGMDSVGGEHPDQSPPGSSARRVGDADASSEVRAAETRDERGTGRTGPEESVPPVGAAMTSGADEPAAGGDESGVIRVDRSALPAGSRITAEGPDGEIRRLAGTSSDLPAGTHTLVFEAPDHRRFEERVTVEAGVATEWSPDVVRRSPPTRVAPGGEPGSVEGERERAATAIVEAVEEFVTTLSAREADDVVPLLPPDARAPWRALLTSDDVVDFRATLAEEPATTVELEDGRGSARFTLRLAYRNRNRTSDYAQAFTARFERADGEWVLVRVTPAG